MSGLEWPVVVGRVLAYYDGRVVDVTAAQGRQRFNLAAMRIVDNGHDGYATEEGARGVKLFRVERGSRTSKLIGSGDERRMRVLGEMAALLVAKGGAS